MRTQKTFSEVVTIAAVMITMLAFVIVVLAFCACITNAMAQCQSQELAELTASDAFMNDVFGRAVDIDGDVAVVGAYQEGDTAGAAYVYRYDGRSWIEEAKLIASDAAQLDHFGWSIAVDGDTIVVGAHWANVGQWSDSGAAYVFVHDGSSWGQAAKLTADRPFLGDEFGQDVAIDGDRIIVGAHLEDNYGENFGAAYIFQKPSGGWIDMTETAKLTAADRETEDQFGISVSISGNVAVAGAQAEDCGGILDSGSAYLFQFNGSAWTQVAKLSVSDVTTQDRLGYSVAIDGDVVVAGAWGRSDGVEQSGAAFIYEKPSGGWTTMTETAKLTASNPMADDRFGWSASIDGDDIVIGAPTPEAFESGFGAAYAFKRPPGGWSDMTENAKFNGSDQREHDRYALAVSVSGSRAIVGAHIHSHTGTQATGSAYIFGSLSDCQPNGVIDVCDIAEGPSPDSNRNGVPDECEGLASAGRIDGAVAVQKASLGQITLSWDASCIGTDNDYEIYEGILGDFTSHSARFCTTGGELQMTFLPAEDNAYYIVVPRNATYEGSYGLDSNGMERPPAADACLANEVTDCP